MSESIPKLLDFKSLQKISKLIVLPMLITAYIIQTGLTVDNFGISLTIDTTRSFWSQLWQFSAIFVLKSTIVAVPAWLLHHFIPLFYYLTWFNWLQRSCLSIVAIFPISFGMLGLLSEGSLPFISSLNPTWFYTSFVVGFYIMAVESDIENYNSDGHCDSQTFYPRKSFPLNFLGKNFP